MAVKQPTAGLLPDPDVSRPVDEFEAGDLYGQYRRRVLEADNDFIVVIAAASKSGISGVGKTTLAVQLARYFDNSAGGFDASEKSTLDADKFSKGLLTDTENVPDQSAVIFDEAQGTLSGSGTDARRSMADSVMDVTTALSTMRFRQISAVVVTQSTKWIDKRVDDVLDALVLIQPRHNQNEPVKGEVFDTYYNDLTLANNRYTEHIDTVRWEALSKDDPDYQYLHELKQQSALNQVTAADDEDDEEQSLPKEKQVEIAQELRNNGMTLVDISNSPLIDYSRNWVSEHTEPMKAEQ